MWNEANIDFWNGVPRQEAYFQLYDHTARDLKLVSPRLRIGGPATAAAHWVPDFLKHAADTNTPVDFVSTHGYAGDSVADLLGPDYAHGEEIPEDDRVCLAIQKIRGEIKRSSMPDTPLFWTEWNVQGDQNALDTPFVGPAVANTIRECDGNVAMMSFWTFSDVFEEGGPMPRPFEGAFGLRAEFGINKPSFYDFALLHKLGDQRYANASHNALVTKRADGKLVIAIWNQVDPGAGSAARQQRRVTLTLREVAPRAQVTVERVDAAHGNSLPAYAAMGRPDAPTPAQVALLNQASALPTPEHFALEGGSLHLTLAPNALVLVTVPAPCSSKGDRRGLKAFTCR